MFEVTDELLRLATPPDPAVAAASKLWAERVNPVWWQTRTALGDWLTDERRTWRTLDGHWLAQLHRSATQRRVFMAVWHDGAYVGAQDDIGWHPVVLKRCRPQLQPAVRSLPLPLAS